MKVVFLSPLQSSAYEDYSLGLCGSSSVPFLLSFSNLLVFFKNSLGRSGCRSKDQWRNAHYVYITGLHLYVYNIIVRHFLGYACKMYIIKQFPLTLIKKSICYLFWVIKRIQVYFYILMIRSLKVHLLYFPLLYLFFAICFVAFLLAMSERRGSGLHITFWELPLRQPRKDRGLSSRERAAAAIIGLIAHFLLWGWN